METHALSLFPSASRITNTNPAVRSIASSKARSTTLRAATPPVGPSQRRAAFRRPGAGAPCARVVHPRKAEQRTESMESGAAVSRAVPEAIAIDSSRVAVPITVVPHPTRSRRRMPFLTWTRLLLGRDGLAALSMTGVFAILLFL